MKEKGIEMAKRTGEASVAETVDLFQEAWSGEMLQHIRKFDAKEMALVVHFTRLTANCRNMNFSRLMSNR